MKFKINARHLFLFCFLSLYVHATFVVADDEIRSYSFTLGRENNLQCTLHDPEKQYSGWGAIIKKYAGSLVTGTIIGTITGTSCYFFDQYVPFPFCFPISWLIFASIREKIVNSIIQDLHKYGADPNETLIADSAWISDWLSYIHHILILPNRRPLVLFKLETNK